MALSANWNTQVITIPLSELTFVSGTYYTLTVDYWWQLLRELNGSVDGIAETIGAPLYTNIAPTSSTPRIVNVNTPWTCQFEDGLYSVDFINGNTNWREVEIRNQVSVGTNNTAAFIDPTFLESSLFVEGIIIDVVNGVAGIGKTGSGAIIGTRQTPSSNIIDADAIAAFRGTHDFVIKQPMTIAGIDLSHGHRFVGDSPFTVLTFDPTANVSGCAAFNISLAGEIDGFNSIENCNMLAMTGLSGFVHNTNIAAELSLSGFTKFMKCYTNRDGVSTITPGVNPFEMDDCHGSVIIDGMTGGDSEIEIYGGTITINATCTGGTLNIVGTPYEIIDNSSGTVVTDNTGDIKTGQLATNNNSNTDNTQDIYDALYNRRKHDKTANTITLYAADNITPQTVWDALDDLTEIIPQ